MLRQQARLELRLGESGEIALPDSTNRTKSMFSIHQMPTSENGKNPETAGQFWMHKN